MKKDIEKLTDWGYTNPKFLSFASAYRQRYKNKLQLLYFDNNYW